MQAKNQVQVTLTLLLAFGATVLWIASLRPFATRFGLVDRPDHRKTHQGVIPLIGGIAIWFGLTLSLLILGVLDEFIYLIIAGGVLVIVGAADDLVNLSAKWRLVLHILAALIMCIFADVVVRSLGELFAPGFEVRLGAFAIPFTVFAVVALINAVNMADGLDGLSGLQLLIPFAGLAFVTGIKGESDDFLALLAICGCLLGFLSFNLRTPWRARASVFLGDAGSNFLGLVLAWFLIHLSQGEHAILRPAAVLWFALLLIYDTVEVVLRRIVRGESPFQANREHLHDVFVLAGFSVSETVLTMGAITLLGVLLGVITVFVNVPDSIQLAAFVLVGLLFLRLIFRTWSVMRFLYRSICRRREERRRASSYEMLESDRRRGGDRRGDPKPASKRQT